MTIELPLDQMTVTEKLDAMEAIWVSLDGNRDEIKSPAWHGEVLRERQRQVDAGEEEFIPWEEAKKNLLQRSAARKK